MTNKANSYPLCGKHERGVGVIGYNLPFRITKNIGNNVFCFDKVKNPKLYVPSLISVDIDEFKSNIDNYLKIGSETVFREQKINKNIKPESSKSLSSLKINENSNPSSSSNITEPSKISSSHQIKKYHGLKNFIQINRNILPSLSKKGIGDDLKQTIYIIDNHNHALYFRYKEHFAGNIKKGSKLMHIDQHTDMNENKYVIASKTKQSINLELIFNFTNQNCNVGNFIKPAVEEGLIGNITQINTEYSLLGKRESIFAPNTNNFILDIDLDFRAPQMSIEKYQKTINITKKLIQNSRVVTIATSPYFLDQNLAIKIIKDLLN